MKDIKANQIQTVTLEQIMIMDQLHRHFANLAYWFRTLAGSLKDNTANKYDVYGRIFEEPRAITDIMEPFTGREKGHQFESLNQSYLVADHIAGIFIPDRGKPEFQEGEKVASMVYHPPEITNGTMVTIGKPYPVTFYAVMLPNRELHRWLADFELEPQDLEGGSALKPGDMAIVISDEGHGHMITKGTTVRIEKVFGDTYLYDIILPDGEYHRWLAEFELVRPA